MKEPKDGGQPFRKGTMPAYTRADLRKWRADMLLKQPGPIPTPALVKGVNIVAFTLGTSRNGAFLRVVDGTGGPPVTMLLNPVVAAALRDGIIASGKDGGWLDKDGNPTEPILDR